MAKPPRKLKFKTSMTLAVSLAGALSIVASIYSDCQAAQKPDTRPPIIKRHALSSSERAKELAELKTLTQKLSANPLDTDALASRAMVFLRLEQLDEAGRDASRAITVDRHCSKAAVVAYNLSYRFQKDMEEEKELQYLDVTIRAMPDCSELQRERADLLHAMRRPEEAVKAADKALAVDPENLYAYQTLGNCYSDIGLDDKAIASYKKAQTNPHLTDNALLALAGLYEKHKNYKEAIDSYSQLLNKPVLDDLNRLHSLNSRAENYQKIGEPAKALQDYETVLKQPCNFKHFSRTAQLTEPLKAMQGRATIHTQLKRYDEAIKDYTALISNKQQWESTNPEWYRERAKLYRLTGKAALATADDAAAARLAAGK